MKKDIKKVSRPIRRGSFQHKILNLRLFIIHLRLASLNRRYSKYLSYGFGYISEVQKTSNKILKLNEKIGKLLGYDLPRKNESIFSRPKPEGDWDNGRKPWDHH